MVVLAWLVKHYYKALHHALLPLDVVATEAAGVRLASEPSWDCIDSG